MEQHESIVYTLITLALILVLMAPALNIPFSAGLITVNFAKVGIASASLILLFLVYEDICILLSQKNWWIQPLVLTFIIWLVYLLSINIPASSYPTVSIKYFARILGSIILAGLYAKTLKRYPYQALSTTTIALFISLLLISVILLLDIHNIAFFEEFRKTYLLSHSKNDWVAHGFYQNQNELAWAAVLHLALIFWVNPNHSWYRVMAMSSWVLCLWIIVSSTSRSSFIGFSFVSIFSAILFFKARRVSLRRNRWYIFPVISFIFLFSILILYHLWLPQRVVSALQQVSNQFSFSELLLSPKEFFEGLAQSIAKVRFDLWVLAAEKFSSNPFTGIGLGAFKNTTFPIYGVYHTTHNFVYTILVDQGLIGFCLLFLACIFFALEPYSLNKLFFLLVLPLSMLFDDLSPSYTFSSYSALWLGFMFANYEPTIDWKAKVKLYLPDTLRFIAKAFQLIFFFIAAKYIALDVFGKFAYGLVVFSLILGPLLSLGVEQLLLRERVDLNPNYTASYRNNQLLVAFGLFGPLLLLGTALSFSIVEITLLWLLFLLRAWEQTLLVTWRANRQILKETLANAISRFISLSFLVYCIGNPVSLKELITFQVIPLFYVIPFLLFKQGWLSWKFPFWKPGAVLAFSQLSWLLYYRVDQVMIEWILSLEKVGVYEIAYRSFEAAIMPAALLLATPMAVYARSSGIESTSIYKQQLKVMLGWGGIGFLGTCVAAVFLSFLYSELNLAQLPTTVFILSIGVIPVFLGSLYSQLLILNGNEKVFAKITLLIVGINVILNYFLLPLLGIYGAAIATVACELMVCVFCAVFFKRMGFVDA